MDWLVIALLVANLAFLVLLWRRGAGGPEAGLLLLQNQIQHLSRATDDKLGQGARAMFESMKSQFEQSQRLVTDTRDLVHQQLNEVAKGISETKESSKQVFSIAVQLQNLERVLTHQKQRGLWGEASLELVLGNILPPSAYKMQHVFPDGSTVDAAIFTKEGIVPVDAKLSLDNYSRLAKETDESRRSELQELLRSDLKARIDETSKYVRDGTLPFALMYIPAEAIYYDLLVHAIGAGKAHRRSLIEYAYAEKKVIIVSPTTFAAYLHSILHGFKAFRIEEAAKHIAKNVETLSSHLKAYEDCYRKLGASLSTTVNHYNAGYRELSKVDKDVLRITGAPAGIEPVAVERPAAAGVE